MYAASAILKALIKMARVVVTLKIMPESPESDLDSIENEAKSKILEFSENSEMRSVQEPIAFGIKALKITFVMEESKGSTESLEENIKTIEGVNSVDTIDVRRAVG